MECLLQSDRHLGRSGIRVAPIAMGTVALGMDYGLSGPMGAQRPDDSDASELLNTALDLGVNFFDTAPAYGCSEQVVGDAIGHRSEAIIATKVSVPRNRSGELLSSDETQEAIEASLTLSLSRLGREHLDVVQIHNAAMDVLERGDIGAALEKAKRDGKLRALGASVYGVDCAMKVIESGLFDVVQVAYNILDQRMGSVVLPAADEAGVGVIIRSAFLKGVLTPRGQWLDGALLPLRQAACGVVESVSGTWEALPATALQFCAAAGLNSTVLVGVRSKEELHTAVEALRGDRLGQEELAELRGFALQDDRLLNPSKWPRESVVN